MSSARGRLCRARLPSTGGQFTLWAQPRPTGLAPSLAGSMTRGSFRLGVAPAGRRLSAGFTSGSEGPPSRAQRGSRDSDVRPLPVSAHQLAEPAAEGSPRLSVAGPGDSVQV